MIKEVPINQIIPIAEMGNLFVIRKKNSINGKIEFSTGTGGESISYLLNMDEDKTFDIPKIIETRHLKYIPKYVEFKTDEKLDSIIVDIF